MEAEIGEVQAQGQPVLQSETVKRTGGEGQEVRLHCMDLAVLSSVCGGESKRLAPYIKTCSIGLERWPSR